MKNTQKSKNKIVYLDNASATPIDKDVLFKIQNAFKEHYANPNSLHDLGEKIKNHIKEIKKNILRFLKSENGEIIFTSGATESNNLAILGILASLEKEINFTPHIVISNIEHASVLELCKNLEKNKKIQLSLLPVENNGIINTDILKKYLKKNTVLVSVMHVNNEIGTIQPIKEIAKQIRHFRKINNSIFPFFHSDITQAVNYLDINLMHLGIDMASFNSAKIYGPKGVGVLYKNKNIKLSPLFYGGEQEYGLRPGTENYPLIVGLYESLIKTLKIKDKEVKRLLVLQKYFIDKLKKVFKKYNVDLVLNGDSVLRIPNNINILNSNIPSDLLLIELSNYGIFVSEKSACKSGDKKNSHVIEAIEENKKQILNSLRFSLGRDTKKEDLNYVISTIERILKKLNKWYT